MDNHLEILEETLQLQHMAPTAPDTLGKSKSVTRTFCLFDRSRIQFGDRNVSLLVFCGLNRLCPTCGLNPTDSFEGMCHNTSFKDKRGQLEP